MDRENVFVGLPYLFKMLYEELKRNTPRFEEQHEQMKRLAENSPKHLGELKTRLTKMQEEITILFKDLSQSAPKKL
jgi:hypothetical protein